MTDLTLEARDLAVELTSRRGEVATALARPGGILASGAFPIDRPRGEAGPPWPYPPEDMDAVLEAALPGGFERVHTGQPVHLTDAVFPWLHQLVIWRRRQAGS